MLHLYQSNRLETLATLLHEGVLAQPLSEVYARETIIVQARGMGRWLGLKIAARFGVCANVDFPLPATFLWQLIEQVLGAQSRQGPFGSDAMAWRLHALLAEPPAALAGYLQDGSERRRWRLASRIADVFDQYLVYRPDWLEKWEAGQSCGLGADETWQMALWRQLAADRDSPHRADLMRRLINTLRSDTPLQLPERIVLFGTSSLPPLLLEVLHALAKRIDVGLFALNPSAAPWGDINRQADTHAPGERLLASWGGQGRVFFDELAAADELHSLFDDQPPPPRLLAQLQHDILELQSTPQRPLLADDDSLAIHACHGPMRQVETLKDALLARFARYPDLQPADVVVLCPNMDDYAPYIDAVFGQGEASPAARHGLYGSSAVSGPHTHIPYAVADRGGLTASPLLAGFIALLQLPDGNWEADRLAALLEIPALAHSFGLQEEDLPQLRNWLASAGIRRGEAGDAFSWQAGIGRLLLGVAMPAGGDAGADLPLFAGLYPTDALDLRFATRVAGLARFGRQLASWQRSLAKPRPLSGWASELTGWLARWFTEEDTDRHALDTLRAGLQAMVELAERSGMDQPVGRVAVQEWLRAHLQQGSGAGGFLTGGVTFAQLMPMRNLPFRVVAVLGLDDGAFPREAQADGFDLIARHPRRGDRARALDERWLFLETLLAARDSLLLFYTGRDARSDAELPPSTVIADLLDAVRAGWLAADGGDPSRQLWHHHPLQAFSPTRFAPNASQASFDGRWAHIARLAGNGTGQPPTLANGSLPSQAGQEDIALTDLIAFARDSSSWFLRQLGVRFEQAEAPLDHRELYSLDGASQRALLQLAGEHADAATELAALGQGAALLPTGLAGELWAQSSAQYFGPAVAAWRGLGRGEAMVDIRLGNSRLHGLLRGLDEHGLGLRQAGKLRESDRLAAWIGHLALCASGLPQIESASRLVGLEEIAHYTAPGNSRGLLDDWLAAYRMAQRRPVPLLARSSMAYAEGLIAKKDPGPDKALRAAQSIWEGNDRLPGEGSYDSVRALWRGQAPFDDDFAALAEQLLLPLLQHETVKKLT